MNTFDFPRSKRRTSSCISKGFQQSAIAMLGHNYSKLYNAMLPTVLAFSNGSWTGMCLGKLRDYL